MNSLNQVNSVLHNQMPEDPQPRSQLCLEPVMNSQGSLQMFSDQALNYLIFPLKSEDLMQRWIFYFRHLE